MSPQRTPLFEVHQQAGARLIDFGGWEMPVQYSSIVDEHLCVRNNVGIFDISHMGEVVVTGNRAAEFLNQLLTNDIRKLSPGQGQYTLMCNERGGVIDDLYAYQTGPTEYLLVINASRITDDIAWVNGQLARSSFHSECTVTDKSGSLSAVAIQGPKSPGLMDAIFTSASVSGTSASHPSELKKNELGQFPFDSGPVWICRTGYTGEDGFEVLCENEFINRVWDRAANLGHPFCLQPIGLGARDTLRTEMCYPLYGHELNEDTTPIEAGVGFFVSLEKGDFIGRNVLAEQKAIGAAKRCIAFKMTGKSPPPRPNYAILANGERVGETCSGTLSPSLNAGIGLGYVPPEFAKPDTEIEIEIRNRRFPAIVTRKPIYKKES